MATIKASDLQPYQDNVKGFIIKTGYTMGVAGYGGNAFNRVTTGTRTLYIDFIRWEGKKEWDTLYAYVKISGKKGVSTIRFYKNEKGEYLQNHCSVPSRLF